jgi:hypothetical protein
MTLLDIILSVLVLMASTGFACIAYGVEKEPQKNHAFDLKLAVGVFFFWWLLALLMLVEYIFDGIINYISKP